MNELRTLREALADLLGHPIPASTTIAETAAEVRALAAEVEMLRAKAGLL